MRQTGIAILIVAFTISPLMADNLADDIGPDSQYVIECKFHGFQNILNRTPTALVKLAERASIPVGTAHTILKDGKKLTIWRSQSRVIVPGSSPREMVPIGRRVSIQLTHFEGDIYQYDVRFSSSRASKNDDVTLRYRENSVRMVVPARIDSFRRVVWQRDEDGEPKTWIELKATLVPEDSEVVEELVQVAGGQKIPDNTVINDINRRHGLVRHVIVAKQPNEAP